MDKEQLKKAFFENVPVTVGGIEYAHISALIYRKHGGRIILQAELMDKGGNSVTIAQPEKVGLI